MALSDTTDQPKKVSGTYKLPQAKVPAAFLSFPFFSTALGHAVASIGATIVLYLVSLVLSDPALASALGIGGLGYTILTIVRLALDPTVPNLPSSN